MPESRYSSLKNAFKLLQSSNFAILYSEARAETLSLNFDVKLFYELSRIRDPDA